MKPEEYTKTEQALRKARRAAEQRRTTGICCEPVTLASFQPETSVPQVFLRHGGPFCAGQEDPIQFGPWFHRGERTPA